MQGPVSLNSNLKFPALNFRCPDAQSSRPHSAFYCLCLYPYCFFLNILLAVVSLRQMIDCMILDANLRWEAESFVHFLYTLLNDFLI